MKIKPKYMHTRLLSVNTGVYFSQSKNCWLYIQIGETAFFFWKWFGEKDTDDAIRIEICTP